MRAYTSAATERPSTTSRHPPCSTKPSSPKSRTGRGNLSGRREKRTKLRLSSSTVLHASSTKTKTGVFSLPLVQPFAAAFLPTGIEPSGQESSEMKAQAHGTKGASRNSAPGIARVRSGRVVGINTLILRKLLLGNDLKESAS